MPNERNVKNVQNGRHVLYPITRLYNALHHKGPDKSSMQNFPFSFPLLIPKPPVGPQNKCIVMLPMLLHLDI